MGNADSAYPRASECAAIGQMVRANMLRAALFSLLLVAPLCAQSREMDVSPTGGWADTSVDVKAGDTLQISATGQLQYGNAAQPNGPAGLPRSFTDLTRVLPLNDAGRGALLGRIGSNSAARPFLIGEQSTTKTPIDGRLFLAINQSALDEASGAYHVVIMRTAAATTGPANVTVPFFPRSLIDSIPKQVSDAKDAPGDRVNFIIIGSQEQMQAAFKAAGWVVVDRTEREAVMSGLFGTFSKEAYVTLPMSELRLFGRPQDFGYAQADPLRVVASRHHFRIWKAPDQLDGLTVWAGAGTHDIGFDRDQRNNGVTHRIDPDTDAERDYIRDSLMQTGLVVKAAYVTPTDPVLAAKTATGSSFHSDGRTLLIYLAGASGDATSSASATTPK